MQVELENLPSCSKVQCTQCRRPEMRANAKHPHHSEDWSPVCPLSDREAIAEAKRCLYCGAPGCVTSCPTSVNAKAMVHAASVGDFYYGAKVALSANPFPLSTSQLCECDEGQCQSGCNLAQTRIGAIRIGEIQQVVVRRFMEMGITPIVDPSAPLIRKSVAIIGAGPAGISAAVFLKRLNVEKVTVYEKNNFAGGLLVSQISQHRLPIADVQSEINLATQLGVEIKLNTEITAIDKLATQNDAVVVAVGRSAPIALPFCQDTRDTDVKIFQAGDFLWQTNKVKKLGHDSALPDVANKKVLVLGAGNTAMDCAAVARRLGATKTTLVFRKQIDEMRAAQSEIQEAMQVGIQFQSLSQPIGFTKNGLTVEIQEKNGEKYQTTGQKLNLSCDVVIVAFGSTKLPLSFKSKNVYSAGDFADSVSIVEAVNDGKTAAAEIYEVFTGKKLVAMPEFFSSVDMVDISTKMNGIAFQNPFLVSSSPTSLTYEHCRRALLAGFGGVVTKTALVTKDVHIENAMRIFKTTSNPGDNTYGNNCMATDHPHEYWAETIRKLKAEFPQKIIIGSIMCQDNQEDWVMMSLLFEAAGADGLELNFSCPNQCAGEGDQSVFADKAKCMAMAIGQIPDSIRRCTKYVTEKVHIPVYCKLTPNHIQGELDEYARAALAGGALGVTYSNTVSALAKVFPSGYPYPQIGKGRESLPSNGYSGSAIRPIVLAGIGKIRLAIPVDKCGLLGIGGIESADTAYQYILMGCQVVEICSAIQSWSYEIVDEMINGLKFFLYCQSTPRLRAYLDQYGEQSLMPFANARWAELSTKQDQKVPSLPSMTGIALQHLVNREHLAHAPQWFAKAFVDAEKCIGCGSCATSCRDNSAHAFLMEGGKARVNQDWCIGCMLCSTVCPVGAIQMKEVATQTKFHYHTE